MTSSITRILFVVAVALSTGWRRTNVRAQVMKGESQSRAPTSRCGHVRMPPYSAFASITVVDKKGAFVSGLTKADFQVLEDKVQQQIETFSDDVGRTLPLYVGVLMDTSPSTAGKLKFEQESAMNFIQTVVRPRKDRVFFATFDDEINLRQDFTDRLDLLERR